MTAQIYLRVAVDVPLPGLFDYAFSTDLSAKDLVGSLVKVPWSSGQRIGIVFDYTDSPTTPVHRIKAIIEVVQDAPKVSERWRALIEFAARYYHCGIGELGVPAIPKVLRTPLTKRSKTVEKRLNDAAQALHRTNSPADKDQLQSLPALNHAQSKVLEHLSQWTLPSLKHGVRLLCGVTGSGKTEVYLRWFSQILNANPRAQVLLLVPEIGLTPQLLKAVQDRFPSEPVAVLHSGLTEAKRAVQWLNTSLGEARIIVGTRLAVLTPIPNLNAIVVDEEHDASYRQMDGVHYSARDLAVARGHLENLPVLLGSATPSMESWVAAQRGRYQLSRMTERATGVRMPTTYIQDIRKQRLKHGFSEATVKWVQETLAQQRQVLVFINRRGYSPVLQCAACGWVSACDACSGHRVLHKAQAGRYRLICHHCTSQTAVPAKCPACGNVDLQALGRGTQRVEDNLPELFPDARVARLDRDVSSKVGAAQKILDAIHAREVDLIVGTQILAKGHDFQALGLVVVLDADQGLFSSDFRAPERLFANLMQVAGRAGRAAAVAGAPPAKVLIQTNYPDHPIFSYLQQQDFEGFAEQTLREREETDLPPYQFQALLKAQARDLNQVMTWLKQAQTFAQTLNLNQTEGQTDPHFPPVKIYTPVPMPIARIAHLERAQLLIESPSRKRLHEFINEWLAQLRSVKSSVRWQLEVDPQEI